MRDPFRPGDFVRAAGTLIGYTIEQNADAQRIDHLSILVQAGKIGTIEIALNTFSLRSFNAGFDGRVRLAVLSSNWSALPPTGLSRSGGLDYSALDANNRIVYRELDRPVVESLLIEKLDRAVLIEAWGEFYKRRHPGIHQIHSRRASCSVSADHRERDGAIRFYFEKHTVAELLLFKFCGQM